MDIILEKTGIINMLNLKKLEEKLDNSLKGETEESLKKWLEEMRKKE